MIHHFTISALETGVILPVFIVNSSTGAALTGLTALAYYTASLKVSYHQPGNAESAGGASLADMALGVWDDLGFKEIDATNFAGCYQFGLPPEIEGTEGRWVITLYGATNMAPCRIIVDVQTLSVGQVGKIVQAQR
jgi:hypothetical protein